MSASPTLKRIRRHPIKSVGGEDLSDTLLSAGAGIEGDRRYAILHQDADHRHGGGDASWLPKSCFIRGAAAPKLAAIKGGWRGGRIHLAHPERPDLDFDPESEGARLVEWLRPLWPESRPASTRMVRAQTTLTDQRTPLISLHSLAELDHLSSHLGRPIQAERFRGNLWLSDFPVPRAQMIGRHLRIGTTMLEITAPITRCPATNADPDRGVVDIDMPQTLCTLWGAAEFGLFATVKEGGQIRLNDPVEVLP